jgi:hypothetical protein
MFEAYHGALNIIHYGWQWAGLQDMATSSDRAAHPFLYIHHVNFGLYFSYLLSLLGIKSIEGQNFVSISGSLFGLYFGYRCLRHITGVHVAGIFFLLFACLDSFSATTWSFNIHRAFSLFAVFGTLLSYINYAGHHFLSKKWAVLFFLSTFILIGTDYMFYFSVLFLLVMYPMFFWDRFSSTNIRIFACSVPIAFFGAMFVLRQAQVIIGMGFNVWATDFVYQFFNRLHIKVEDIFPNWIKDTSSFYSNNYVLNPGFARLLNGQSAPRVFLRISVFLWVSI